LIDASYEMFPSCYPSPAFKRPRVDSIDRMSFDTSI